MRLARPPSDFRVELRNFLVAAVVIVVLGGLGDGGRDSSVDSQSSQADLNWKPVRDVRRLWWTPGVVVAVVIRRRSLSWAKC